MEEKDIVEKLKPIYQNLEQKDCLKLEIIKSEINNILKNTKKDTIKIISLN